MKNNVSNPFFYSFLAVADLLSLLLVILDIYLWREWLLHRDSGLENGANGYLAAAILLLLYITCGRFLTRTLLSKTRTGEDQPQPDRCTEQHKLKRPDGSFIHFEECGTKGKPVLLFIHGLTATSQTWYYQKKFFADEYHLVFMDLPGHGKSDRPVNKDYSLERLSTDLYAVIEKVKPHELVIWGHSMGGMCILTFLKYNFEHLQPIAGVILQNTSYTNPLKTIKFNSLLSRIQHTVLKPILHALIVLSPVVQLMRMLSYLNGHLHITIRLLVYAGTQSPQQLEFSSRISASSSISAVANSILAMFRYDATEILDQVNIPVLIFAADRDVLTKPEASETMNQSIPNSRLVKLAPSGHYSHVEQHQHVNMEAGIFIKNLVNRSI